jgi:hypothetical protein
MRKGSWDIVGLLTICFLSSIFAVYTFYFVILCTFCLQNFFRCTSNDVHGACRKKWYVSWFFLEIHSKATLVNIENWKFRVNMRNFATTCCPNFIKIIFKIANWTNLVELNRFETCIGRLFHTKNFSRAVIDEVMPHTNFHGKLIWNDFNRAKILWKKVPQVLKNSKM